MLFPSKDSFIKEYSEYDKVPVMKEIMFDKETPISLTERFQTSKYSMLLESVEGGEKWARYSFIGRDPSKIYKIKGQKIEIIQNGDVTNLFAEDPLEYIKNITSQVKYPSMIELPRLCSGLVGYFSYDTARYVEKIPDKNIDDLELPDILLMQFDEIYAFDHLKHSLMIIVNVDIRPDQLEEDYQRAIELIKVMEKDLHSSNKETLFERKKGGQLNIDINVSKREFMSMVEKAREYIHEGDIFQVVLSQRLKTNLNSDPFFIYRMLRMINPSPYMFYLKMNDFSLVGASPEMLLRVIDGVVETCPIAGTRKRGASEEEEIKIEKELLDDEKEIAEHTMLVDLGRNDIGKISDLGSVVVENFMHIEKFSHVMHIVTNVKGNLNKNYSSIDALMSVLPAGTLSGAPKIRAMEIIEEQEMFRRGPYGGATGYFSFNGNADFCITIRTIVIKGDSVYIQSGAGIVADSDPEKEYEESMAKAMAMIKAVEKAGEKYDSHNR